RQSRLHPQPGPPGALLTLRGCAHQRLDVHHWLRCRVFWTPPRGVPLVLDRPVSVGIAADAGRGARDARPRRDAAGDADQAASAPGGVCSRVVIARNPLSTSPRSIASRSARNARAMAITCALNVT